MRKLFALLSLLVVASMALAACGGSAAPIQATATPDTTSCTRVMHTEIHDFGEITLKSGESRYFAGGQEMVYGVNCLNGQIGFEPFTIDTVPSDALIEFNDKLACRPFNVSSGLLGIGKTVDTGKCWYDAPDEPFVTEDPITTVLKDVFITIIGTPTTCSNLQGWGSPDSGTLPIDLVSDRSIGYEIRYDGKGTITVKSHVGDSTQQVSFQATEGINTLRFYLGDAFWNMEPSSITVVTNVMICGNRMWTQISPLPIPDIQENP